MGTEEKLFHESWHRIANQKIVLRSSVRITRQMYRGKKWYIVADAFSNNYYRLRPSAYEFIARLGSNRTVEEVWKESLSLSPDDTPGQGEVIELLAQLYHANLLHYDIAPDSSKLFERFRKKKQRLLRANLLNIMFFRIPVFDPSNLINRLQPLIRALISSIGALIWLAVLAVGVKFAIDNATTLWQQTEGILAPSNLFLLYIGMVIIKVLHEFGHAFAVRRFGGEVHTMGIMFLIFSPLPYMDATAAWAFRNKWKRIFVGSAGMIFELFVASCAVIVWANTGDGVLHSLMYNMIFVASVSTIIFNINPLLRYDGYYILSDLLNIPNLNTQSQKLLVALMERYAFGCKNREIPSHSGREKVILSSFGILSTVYRFVVFSGILLFIADRFLLAGIIMAGICAIAWICVPVIKFVKYLGSSPQLEKVRGRAVVVTALSVIGFVIVFGVIPFPCSTKAPGIIKASEYAIVVNETDGNVAEVIARSGKYIKAGMPLIRLENHGLELDLQVAQAAMTEAEVRYKKAMQEMQADMQPIMEQIDYLTKRSERLQHDYENLVIKAPVNGIWIAPHSDEMNGMWMVRGTPLGQIVNDSQFQFVSAVSQQNIAELFSEKVKSVKIKITGEAQHEINVLSYVTIPMEQRNLPSSALGWGAGGEIATDVDDKGGIKTVEPFYEVRAVMQNTPGTTFYHGRSGWMKFNLPMKPLLRQGWQKLRQTIQKRYKI